MTDLDASADRLIQWLMDDPTIQDRGHRLASGRVGQHPDAPLEEDDPSYDQYWVERSLYNARVLAAAIVRLSGGPVSH